MEKTFFDACAEGNLPKVKELIFQGYSSNGTFRWSGTPLTISCGAGHHNVVSHLIDSGANLDMKDHFRRTPLHHTCVRGHMQIVEMLLNAGAKIDEVDSNHSTPLMFAVYNGHVDVVSRLLKAGADVTKQSNDGKTALHIAADRGHLEIAKLLLDNGAEVDREDNDFCTPLVLSALEKKFDVMLHLITSGADVRQLAKYTPSGRDPGRKALSCAIMHKNKEVLITLIINGVAIDGLLSTKPPITALMWMAQEGYDSLMKHLILQGVNVNYQNPYGHTALHFAAQSNRIQCGILLVEAGADVNTVNKASQTPLTLSSSEFKDAILQALSFQTKKTVCVIGNALSGKSTLIASLQNENASFMKKIRNRLFGVQNISERTAGIEPVALSSKHYGDVMFFDFAGQHEYHGPHETFLESILSKGTSTVTIIVVVKATEDSSVICHQLNRWLHPFSKMSSSVNPIRVIIIGSHMDKVKCKVKAKEKLYLCYEKVKNSLCDVPLKVEDLCYLDCRQPYSTDMTKLCAYLSDVPPPQYKAVGTQYSISWVISRIRTSLDDKVISVLAFSDWIMYNKANLPTNLPPAEEVCKDLSATGHFLYIPGKENTGNGWLILDLPSLLHEVYGTLFSPSKKIVNMFGLLSYQRLLSLFPTLDPSMVRDVLISLEFCVEVHPSALSESIHRLDSSDEGHGYLLFPALVSGKPPKIFIDARSKSKVNQILAWQLVVGDLFFVSPRLLQTIILRLVAHHVFHRQKGSVTREHYCNVWWNGIFWQSTKDVDIAVQISDSTLVQVIGRSESSPDVLCTYISMIVQYIFATIHELSPSLSGAAYMIHPVNPQMLLENPRSPSAWEMFPVDVILESRRNGGSTCLSCNAVNKMAERKAVSDIFCGFQPSVDAIEKLLRLSCKYISLCMCMCIYIYSCMVLCVCGYITNVFKIEM